MSWFWVREFNFGLHMAGWVMYQFINIEEDDSFLFKFKYIIIVRIVCVCVCLHRWTHVMMRTTFRNWFSPSYRNQNQDNYICMEITYVYRPSHWSQELFKIQQRTGWQRQLNSKRKSCMNKNRSSTKGNQSFRIKEKFWIIVYNKLLNFKKEIKREFE